MDTPQPGSRQSESPNSPEFALLKPTEKPLPVLATADQSLATALMKGGMLTAEQLHAAHRYGEENHRDFRQAILELGILTTDKLNGHWAVIYSKYDIGCALERHQGLDCKGYSPESAVRIATNIVIYATLP